MWSNEQLAIDSASYSEFWIRAYLQVHAWLTAIVSVRSQIPDLLEVSAISQLGCGASYSQIRLGGMYAF